MQRQSIRQARQRLEEALDAQGDDRFTALYEALDWVIQALQELDQEAEATRLIGGTLVE